MCARETMSSSRVFLIITSCIYLPHTLHPWRSALTCAGIEYMAARSLSRARLFGLHNETAVGRKTVFEGFWWRLGTLVRAELCIVLDIN